MAIHSDFGFALMGLMLGLPLLLAVILGIVSLVRISRSQGRLRGKGLAITGLVLGVLGLGGAPLGLVLAMSLSTVSARHSSSPATSVPSLYDASPRSAGHQGLDDRTLRLEISIHDFAGNESDAESLVRQLEEKLDPYAAEIRAHPQNRIGRMRLLIELGPDADPRLGEPERMERRARLIEQVRSSLRDLDAETGWLQGRFEVEPVSARRARDYSITERAAERPIQREDDIEDGRR